MMTSTVRIRYGEAVGFACQVCFKKRKKFGTLVDPNGHTWLICDKCINKLWRKRQALRQESVLDV